MMFYKIVASMPVLIFRKKLNQLNRILLFITLIFTLTLFTTCETEPDLYKDPYGFTIEDIKIIPETPSMGNQTKVVFNGCNYFRTFKIKKSYGVIEIKKRFNSQLKWDCKTVSDTISLGYLFYGDYTLKFEIIDINPEIKDSVFYVSSKVFNVVLR